MIAFAIAAASVIIAQPPLHARLQMESDGRVHGIVENTGPKALNFVEVHCNLYDTQGLITDAVFGYAAQHMGPHEAARFERTGAPLSKPVRFTCRILHHPELDD